MAQPSEFDPAVVRVFTERLMARARQTVLVWTVLGALVGLTPLIAGTNGVIALLGIVVGALVGAAIGQARSFAFRLAAQQWLWQLAVERHLGRIATGLAARSVAAVPAA